MIFMGDDDKERFDREVPSAWQDAWHDLSVTLEDFLVQTRGPRLGSGVTECLVPAWQLNELEKEFRKLRALCGEDG